MIAKLYRAEALAKDGTPERRLRLRSRYSAAVVGETERLLLIPAIQVGLAQAAPNAPTLMGAMNLAALNVANAMGAWAGSHAIAQDHGLLSAAWAGFGLTLAGLLLFLAVLRESRRPTRILDLELL
ncbi:MAG: hypothetical protein ACLGJD_17565 [Gammaproteobacteria bacterium]